MINGTRVTVTTAATKITEADRVDQTAAIQNEDASLVAYLGGPDVTTTKYGYKLLPGQVFVVRMTVGEALFAVVSSGSLPLNVLTKGY